MNLNNMKNRGKRSPHENGIGLVIVIMIMAFMLTMGVVMMTITGTGTKIAGNVRAYKQAFNSAEAGFDAAWVVIEESFINGVWSDFDQHYLVDPSGIDDPTSDQYFRRRTDFEILSNIDTDGDGNADVGNVIFFMQPFIKDASGNLNNNITYTVFLINEEMGSGNADPSDPLDALLVCIGSVGTGSQMTTSRLEIELGFDKK